MKRRPGETAPRAAPIQLESETAARPRLSTAKKLLFSGIVTVAFLAVLELLLAAAGWRPLEREEDPYVGFLATAPLFVETRGAHGELEMVTAENKLRWFNSQRFAKHKSKQTYRIFCLGGSTTYGHPYDDTTSFAGWLRELLPEVDASRQWEVINAGGISYASYRVAIILEEILAYEPDLFIIYTGHNEFLEARTYGKLKATPQLVMRLDRVCSRTRIYAAIGRLVTGEDDRARLRRLQAEKTLLPAEVNTLLDSAIGPEVYHRDDALRQGIVEHFEFNLHRMVTMARAAGVGTILVTPASNLKDCSPFKSEHRADLGAEERNAWDSYYARAQQQFLAGQLSESLVAIDHVIAIDSRHAGSIYLRGQIRDALGDYAGARQDFNAARDEDVCPVRAPSEIIQIVRDVAANSDVPLVDYVQYLADVSPQGLPGADVFLDHVHPTIEEFRNLAVMLLKPLQGRGVIPRGNNVPPDVLRAVTERVLGRVDRAAHGTALRNLSKVFSWAGKDEDADRLAVQAIELVPDDPDAECQAANALVRRGDFAEGIRRYRRVMELNPDYAPGVHGFLGFAYSCQGDEQQAIEHYRKALELNPNFADIHYNLATIYERRGELEAAATHYRQVIAGNPHYAGAYHRLGIVFARQERWAEAVRLDPNSVDMHLHLGEILGRQGDLAAARAQLNWILRQYPEHQAARAALQQLGR